ncbi:hypothetical protein NIASO_14530 [Niabella soli DSM 19437]|uniref:Uncharacterized protein n=1 Tax=Niabella soli DSM 19437 TaxID=929713 RepID=W0F8L8_9BACT|nr:hypothetical protein NIASO_14530 [Niabella soli DSM 19437]
MRNLTEVPTDQKTIKDIQEKYNKTIKTGIAILSDMHLLQS